MFLLGDAPARANAIILIMAKILTCVHSNYDDQNSKFEDLQRLEDEAESWKDGLFAMLKQNLNFSERPGLYEPMLSIVEDRSMEPIDLCYSEPVTGPKHPGLCPIWPSH